MSSRENAPQFISNQTSPCSSYAADVVLEGGGMRAIAHVGALSVAEARGYRWQHCAGTSAGALVAALLAAGYTAAELRTLLAQLDLISATHKSNSFIAMVKTRRNTSL